MNKIAFVIGLLVVTSVVVFSLQAQRVQSLGAKVSAHQRVPTDQIDHGAFNSLLKKYVNDDGFVNYKSWKASAEDHAALVGYLNLLSSADLSARSKREADLAFWINAYNAVTIEGILQKYPTSSIRNHTSVGLGFNIWKHLKLQVAGKSYSLNSIEHDILRKLHEPRIHFAIVCASIGCPRLLNQAYSAEHLNDQLSVNTKDFFSRERNLQFDAASSTLKLSAIVKWFGEDFGKDQNEQLSSLFPYFPEQIQASVKTASQNGKLKTRYLEYDWNLNEWIGQN